MICISCFGIIAEDSRVHFIPRAPILGLDLNPGTRLDVAYTVTQDLGSSTPSSNNNQQNQGWTQTSSGLLGSTNTSPSNTSFLDPSSNSNNGQSSTSYHPNSVPSSTQISTTVSTTDLPAEVSGKKKRSIERINGSTIAPNVNQSTTPFPNTNSTFSNLQGNTSTIDGPTATIHPFSDEKLFAIFVSQPYFSTSV